MSERPKYIQSKGKIYKWEADDFVRGYFPNGETLVEQEPQAWLNIPRISFSEWEKVIAFFLWSQTTYRSEAQVRLYYHKVNKVWKAWPFPQKANGMTTSEDANSPLKAACTLLFGQDPAWYWFGTVHHHCTMSAFQSGTDANDECNTDGVHITIGKLADEKLDQHARLSYKNTFLVYKSLGCVVDLPEQFTDAFLTQMLLLVGEFDPDKYLLNKSVYAKSVFPEEWKANVTGPSYNYQGPEYYKDREWDSQTGTYVLKKNGAAGATGNTGTNSSPATSHRFDVENKTYAFNPDTGEIGRGTFAQEEFIPKTTLFWLRKKIGQMLTGQSASLTATAVHEHNKNSCAVPKFGIPRFMGYVVHGDRLPSQFYLDAKRDEREEKEFWSWTGFLEATDSVPLVQIGLALALARADIHTFKRDPYATPEDQPELAGDTEHAFPSPDDLETAYGISQHCD